MTLALINSNAFCGFQERQAPSLRCLLIFTQPHLYKIPFSRTKCKNIELKNVFELSSTQNIRPGDEEVKNAFQV